MKNYTSENLRNIAIMGHGGDGKTTLAEAMLFNAGIIDRMGRVDDGSTTMDYDAEETKRAISISTALACFERNDVKVNLIDSPGFFDFEGEQVQALRLADSAIIVVSGVSGLSVGAEKAWDKCHQFGKAKIFFVNQMDRENADFRKVADGLKDKYGNSIVPIMVPIMDAQDIKGYIDILTMKAYTADKNGYSAAETPEDMADYATELHDAMIESAVESDEALMEKYFNGDELTEQEIVLGLREGIANGSIAAVLAGSATANKLVDALMDRLVGLMPSPADVDAFVAKNDKTGDEVEVKCDANGKAAVQVIKTVADPFVGKLSIFRIYSGTISSGMSITNMTTGKQEKVGSVYTMTGKKQKDVGRLIAGDIGAVAKMQTVNTGDTLCDPSMGVVFPQIEFPKPCISMAVTVAKEGDEEKVFGGLSRLEEEDTTFKVKKDPDTLESIIEGMGELHLEVITKKLQAKFGVEAILKDPRIPYRETIRKTVEAEGKHKKQTGGHGQFGHVWIRFEPTEGELEFVDKVVGGVVPRNYIPAVEKGLRENMRNGVLAGYPMTGIMATLYDGSYHSVDSSEMAFRTAARLSLKKGCAMANPVLLEPIYQLNVHIPDDYMGDVIGDINRRRGRIMGMNPAEDGQQEVVAEVPLAEMFKYATDLRSMASGRGSFSMEFVRYEEVPANIAKKVIESAERKDEEDD